TQTSPTLPASHLTLLDFAVGSCIMNQFFLDSSQMQGLSKCTKQREWQLDTTRDFWLSVLYFSRPCGACCCARTLWTSCRAGWEPGGLLCTSSASVIFALGACRRRRWPGGGACWSPLTTSFNGGR